jgi:hypothetical protein
MGVRNGWRLASWNCRAARSLQLGRLRSFMTVISVGRLSRCSLPEKLQYQEQLLERGVFLIYDRSVARRSKCGH